MAKLQHYIPKVAVEAVLTVNLDELRALDALVGYGVDELIKHFYKHMGEAYLKPYEHGLRSFLQAAAGASTGIHQANEAQKALDKFYIEKGKPRTAAVEAKDAAT